MISTLPKLRDDLEVIHGMDDIPMIFDPVTGRYHRVSRSAEAVLQYLDGSRSTDDLITLFSRGEPARSETVRHRLDSFLLSLNDSGLLLGSTPPAAQRPRRWRTSMLMPRFVLTTGLPRLLEPAARRLRSAPAGALATVAGLGAAVGFGAGACTLLTSPRPATGSVGVAFLIATTVQLMLVVLHETAHALVAQYLRTPVRGLGVALLFYFMPVAYVDRTDAYRVRERGSRVALALAGMASDGWACGVVAIVAMSTDGLAHKSALILLGLQMLGLMINTNPLLPSDGYSAIEAATGLVDARGRAFTVLKRAVTRTALPAHLVNLPAWHRRFYLAYGIVCVGYVTMIATSVGAALLSTARTIVGALG